MIPPGSGAGAMARRVWSQGPGDGARAWGMEPGPGGWSQGPEDGARAREMKPGTGGWSQVPGDGTRAWV